MIGREEGLDLYHHQDPDSPSVILSACMHVYYMYTAYNVYVIHDVIRYCTCINSTVCMNSACTDEARKAETGQSCIKMNY